MNDRAVRERVARLETLLEQLESVQDSAVRGLVVDTMQELLGLYGEALERVVAQAQATGGEAVASLVADELISHLLLLHGLHPVPASVRVAAALDEVRPYLRSHGGNVTLVGVEQGVVRVRLEGSCSGCPSSSLTLRHAIEESIQRAAPDVDRIEAIEGAAPEVPAAAAASEELPEGVVFVPAAALVWGRRTPAGASRAGVRGSGTAEREARVGATGRGVGGSSAAPLVAR